MHLVLTVGSGPHTAISSRFGLTVRLGKESGWMLGWGHGTQSSSIASRNSSSNATTSTGARIFNRALMGTSF